MASNLRPRNGGNAKATTSPRGKIAKGQALRKKFEESLHPRDGKGQFARTFKSVMSSKMDKAKELLGKMTPSQRAKFMRKAIKTMRDGCG